LVGGAIFPEYEGEVPNWFRSFEPMLAIRKHPVDADYLIHEPPFDDRFPVGAGFAVRRVIALSYTQSAIGGKRIEGRRGNHLSSAEDIDLAMYVLSKGYSLRTQGCLQLTHVIPAFRLTEAYIGKLAVSSLKSCVEVNEKWAELFGMEVIPLAKSGILGSIARVLLFAGMGAFSPRFRVKCRYHLTLLRRSRARGKC
jgi:hypothetical protein